MLDFDRLKENMVITTERPMQQADERWKYPIFIIKEILRDKKEVVVTNTEDGSLKLMTEQELKRMNLVGASLAYKDRLIREQKRGGSANLNLEMLALAICQEAEKHYPEVSIFMQAMSPELLQKAKAFLQTMIEKDVKLDYRAFTYKTHCVPEQ